MINEYTKRFRAKGKDINTVEATIYYKLGGHNMWSGRNEDRGYYFSITPCEINHGIKTIRVGANGYCGIKHLVVPCQRQSKRRYEEAKSAIDRLIAENLAKWCMENDIELGELYEENERERRVA